MDEAAILSLTTPASWLGLIGAALASWLVSKRGNRPIMLIAAILGGITYMMYGVVNTLAGFTIVTALANFFGMGYCHTLRQCADGQLVSHEEGSGAGLGHYGPESLFGHLCAAADRLCGHCRYQWFLLSHGRSAHRRLGIFSFIVMRDTRRSWAARPDNGTVSKRGTGGRPPRDGELSFALEREESAVQ